MARYTFLGLMMPQMTAAIGYLLTALGSVFWLFTGFVTALFPAFFGAILVISSIGSKVKPEKNAVFMHLAVFSSLAATTLGIATIAVNPEWATSAAAVEQLLMTILSGTHLTVSLASFSYGSPSEDNASRRCGHDDGKWAIPLSNNTANYPSANESSIAATFLVTPPPK
ncbi:MAG: hypothetical protein VW544_04290 [Euryarchaeota archaeon]|jgi:hypothetical protein